MLAAAVLGLTIFFSGLSWTAIVAQLRRGEEPLPERLQRHRLWNPVATILVVLWFGFQLFAETLAAAGGERIEPGLVDVQATCVMNAVVVAILLIVLAWTPGATLADFGIRLGDNWRDVGAGIGGFFASILPTFAIIAVTSGFRTEETMHPFLKILVDNPSTGTVVWLTLAAVVAAPLAEELAFRVVLQRACGRFVAPQVAIPLVALIFSAVHGWPDSLPLVPLALILGYVYHRRNSYLSVVILHGSFNAFNLALVLLASETGAETAIVLGR